MSDSALQAALDRMRAAGIGVAAMAVFEHNYRALESGADGLIREAEIAPVTDLPSLNNLVGDAEAGRAALDQTVIIKLNGGLGTSMGLDRAKMLLPVRDGLSFLDVVVGQVLATRSREGVRLPLLFMTSFRTDADSRAALAKHPTLPVAGLPLTFLQNQEPKLFADSLEPARWPADPGLEWCPPGHGDLFTALQGTGLLATLLKQGYRYACVANGDNLGAAPSADLAGWFAASGAPFAMEVCRRTANDRKGGHIARRLADGRMVLRESAMVAPGELDDFTDEHRHPFFNTNTLWFDLCRLSEALDQRDGVLGLPLIRNVKPIDPTVADSPQVVQMETAMGAAIETFAGATAIEVPRSRFLPVKTTNELLLVRSDCYDLDDAFRLVARSRTVPEIRLDARYYKLIRDFEARIEHAPSLIDADRLVVEGDWTFAPDVCVVGDVTVTDLGAPGRLSGELR